MTNNNTNGAHKMYQRTATEVAYGIDSVERRIAKLSQAIKERRLLNDISDRIADLERAKALCDDWDMMASEGELQMAIAKYRKFQGEMDYTLCGS